MPETNAEPTILVDTPEDYAVEESAWVPVSIAADEAAAINLADKEFPVEETFAYTVAGRSFQRPYEAARIDDGLWFIFDAEGREAHDGRTGYECEFLPWESCAEADPGAVEFWDLTVIEKEPSDA
jgi:hypothetical protein